MSEEVSGAGSPARRSPEEEAARKRRLAAVFGDVLPEETRDESTRGWGDREQGAGDEWLRAQVPPHHG